MDLQLYKARFMRLVYISNNHNDCWVWLGAQSSCNDGTMHYGNFRFKGKVNRVHRISWELFNGPILKGVLVCHKCDNTLCVNPEHLFIGSTLMNMWDRKIKGRYSHQKLTDKHIDEIKNLYATGNYSHRKLGKMFNVTHAAIQKAINGDRIANADVINLVNVKR